MQTILHSAAFIKSVHTAIFVVFSGFIVIFLVEVITDRITPLTWVVVVGGFTEGLVLMLNGWRCPLAIYGERVGAIKSVDSDMWFPKWFTKRVFPVCGGAFAIGLGLLLIREWR